MTFARGTRAIGSALAFNNSKRASQWDRKKEETEEKVFGVSSFKTASNKFTFMHRN